MYKNAYPNNNADHWQDSPSKLYFLAKGKNGKWTDITASLIKNPAERYTCITTTYIEIADFNNDKKT